jgi:hypothetical protein
MPDNKHSYIQSVSAKNFKITAEEAFAIKEENQRLTQDNIHLKKSLENEQLLHANLYKEWKRLKEIEIIKEAELQRYKQASHGMVSKPVFYWLLFIASLLAIITLYNLFFSNGDKNKISSQVTTSAEKNTSIQHENIAADTQFANSQLQDVSLNNSIKKKEPGTPNTEQSKTISISTLNTNTPSEVEEESYTSSDNIRLFKVKSKAYLHTEPDHNTRRNAFIVHWNNSYATLKALDEKNGFVYIVFTNHKGQTSRGWLRKSDLYPVDTRTQ